MSNEPTIRDVANLAGVSVATASRVLNGSSATSAASRESVAKAAQSLKYSPNGPARALRSAKRHTVGLLVSDVRNPFFSELAYSVQMALWDRGYAMLLGNASEREQLQEQYLVGLRSQRVDGLIAAPQGESSSMLEQLALQGLPIVFVDRRLDTPDVPCVNSDPESGIGCCLQQLARDGHRKVGFVGGPTTTSTGRERLDVFGRLAAETFGADGYLTAPGGYDADTVGASVLRLVREGCTALLFGYSPNAMTAQQALRSHDISWPQDVSLVSFDELAIFEMLTPAISIISQGVTQMGATAVDQLMAVMDGQVPDSVRLPTQFIARASSGPVPRGRHS